MTQQTEDRSSLEDTVTTQPYTFNADDSLDLTTVPVRWGLRTLPYRPDWTRWQDHVADCAPCAQYVHELANLAPVYVSAPCPIGTEMIADYHYAVDSQHIEARAN